MKNIKLSIIIVSFNTKTILDNCISSIYSSQINDLYEIIVVDNCSTDGTIEMLETKYPSVKLLKNQENNLFAKANNQGAEISNKNAKFLLLLNSDTIVYDNNIQRMIDYFDTLDENVICIGPKILNQDKTIQSSGYPNPSIMERFVMSLKLYKFLPWFLLPVGVPIRKERPRRVGWVSGSCMLMRREAYIKVGGLNENVEFYGEEPEFGYRTSKLGYNTLYYPYAEIIHLGGQSTATNITIHDATNEEKRLRRYSKLQKETVGYKKAIVMSEIVLLAARIKKMLSKDKDYFSTAIEWEKKVIKYLEKKLNE